MKYHEKLRLLNKSYFNKLYIVLVLSFTYIAFDVFILHKKYEPFIPKFLELSRSFGGAFWFVSFISRSIKIVTENFPVPDWDVKIITGNFPVLYCTVKITKTSNETRNFLPVVFCLFLEFFSSFRKYKTSFELGKVLPEASV